MYRNRAFDLTVSRTLAILKTPKGLVFQRVGVHQMNEQEREVLSIASLSADLAWKLLTLEQQQQLLQYLEKVQEKKITNENTKEIRP